jgi:hypothetical protein
VKRPVNESSYLEGNALLNRKPVKGSKKGLGVCRLVWCDDMCQGVLNTLKALNISRRHSIEGAVGVIKPRTDDRCCNGFGCFKVNVWTNATEGFDVKVRRGANTGSICVKIQSTIKNDTKEFYVIGQIDQ